MRQSIAHRGSDNTGEYLQQNVGLSHTRLSIRDLSNGTQPLSASVNGLWYTIVYNGEIYNAEEIKSQLIKHGYTFETKTDTEVILLAYIHYGSAFVKMLNGIFAFAIWDSNKNELILYRDRVGVKPLFYTLKNNTLVFGSEIKALFCYPDIKPAIDINSFREIFGIGPARTGQNGVFKDIYEVGAGHFIKFSACGMQDAVYWELCAKEHKDSYVQTVEKTSYLVRDAITRQMVSDVPVCSFLSGGIDSSIVTAVAANFCEKNGETLNTFSFDFTGNDKYFESNNFQPERDNVYVEKMLGAYKLNHTYLECGEAQLADYLYKAVDAKDLPGMADVDASLLYFCSLVKRYNKVVLTGECADEIFGGYPWFYREDLLNSTTFPWSKDLNVRTYLLNDSFIKQLDLNSYVQHQYESSINSVPVLFGEDKSASKIRQMSYLNLKWFMQTLLERMDRTSMYSALEARVPFADHRIIKYLFNTPWEYKYQNGVEKALLRDACKDLLPASILNRKKSPYPKTYNPDYMLLLTERLKAIAQNPASPIMNFIDKNKLEQFFMHEAGCNKPWFGQLMAAPQMIAYIIQINYWLQKYNLA